MSGILPPADGSEPSARALTAVLAQLSATDVELTALTGGATAADVLAEFARATAVELAQHFPDLPNQAFDGLVPQAAGWRGWLRGARTIRHRVLAVRYTIVEPALSIGKTMLSYDVTGYLLAIGEDGALRTADVNQEISVEASATIPHTPLPHTDARVRNVPTSRVRMRPWQGGNDPAQVAPPEAVLDILRSSAAMLQAQKQAQGTLLRRLMGA